MKRSSARLATLAFLCSACTSTPVASPAGSPAATQTATAAAASPTTGASQLPPGTFENRTLGYRITFPLSYRLSRSQIVRGQPELVGQDIYTFATEAEVRADCMQDRGDIPTPLDAAFLLVSAYLNPRGVSAREWIVSRPEGNLRTTHPWTINGKDAVSLTGPPQNDTAMYVISANDRMYVLMPTMWPNQHPLDSIAQSFTAIAPQPFPTPSSAPSESPREAAGALSRTLGAAFAARDADAVARSFGSRCWIGVSPVITGAHTGGGVLNRAVALFVPALRDRFAAGDLAVTVDPAVQVRNDAGGDHYFVRSDWREPDRTTPIDLELAEIDGQWRWTGATHYYPSLGPGSCIPYRSPWVSPTPAGRCS